MKLSSVLNKIASGTLVRLKNYITDELIAEIEVDEILDSSTYHKKYKNCEVCKFNIKQYYDKSAIEILIAIE